MIGILLFLIQIYTFIVLARVLLSYFPNVDYSNPIIRFLYDITEPVLQPIRQFIRQQFPGTGPFDFSPLALLVGLWVLRILLVSIT